MWRRPSRGPSERQRPVADATSASYPERIPIDAYGDGGFRLQGIRHEGSLMILPAGPTVWPVTSMDMLSAADLEPVLAARGDLEILILGTGISFARPSAALRSAVESAGLGLEAMDTGAACRTYNVLLAERRRIAAALIAV